MYRIIRVLAPKRRHASLTIRSKEGHLLSQRQQFEAIRDFFQAQYARPDVFTVSDSPADLCISVAEFQHAIGGLRNKKAVPGIACLQKSGSFVRKCLSRTCMVCCSEEFAKGMPKRNFRLFPRVAAETG